MQRPWLLPFIPFFAAGAGIFHGLYNAGLRKSVRVPVPVISIGNITLGGTGKTPFAMWLLRELTSNGVRCAYLSRGYGRKSRGIRQVDPTSDTAESCGDEALMVARSMPDTPVWVGEDRVRAAQMMLQAHPLDILVLDDAYQHRRIHRDLDVVMLDATRLPEDDFLFPAGNLREPGTALRRADVIVINRVPDPVPQGLADGLPPNIPVCLCRNLPGRAVPVGHGGGTLDNTSVAALSGLGNNQQYFDLLRIAGYKVAVQFPFNDHHAFTETEIRDVIHTSSSAGIHDIVTTTKDRMRLEPFLDRFAERGVRIWETPVIFQWVSGEDVIRRALQGILPKLPAKLQP